MMIQRLVAVAFLFWFVGSAEAGETFNWRHIGDIDPKQGAAWIDIRAEYFKEGSLHAVEVFSLEEEEGSIVVIIREIVILLPTDDSNLARMLNASGENISRLPDDPEERMLAIAEAAYFYGSNEPTSTPSLTIQLVPDGPLQWNGASVDLRAGDGFNFQKYIKDWWLLTGDVQTYMVGWRIHYKYDPDHPPEEPAWDSGEQITD